jgi:hypothetical protein
MDSRVDQTTADGTSAGGDGRTLADAFVVLVLCLVLVPALLITTSVPLVPLVLGAGLAYLAIRWPVSAGVVPRIVSGLVALVALLAAFIGFVS